MSKENLVAFKKRKKVKEKKKTTLDAGLQKYKIHCVSLKKKRVLSLSPDCFVHRVILLNSKKFIWKHIFKVFIFILLFLDTY